VPLSSSFIFSYLFLSVKTNNNNKNFLLPKTSVLLHGIRFLSFPVFHFHSLSLSSSSRLAPPSDPLFLRQVSNSQLTQTTVCKEGNRLFVQIWRLCSALPSKCGYDAVFPVILNHNAIAGDAVAVTAATAILQQKLRLRTAI
jgi:hypothetical protein